MIKLRVIILPVLILALISGGIFAQFLPRRELVLFDESHCPQAWLLASTGFFGESTLAKFLLAEGYLVSANTLPLDKALRNLLAHDVLVLNGAKYGNYRRKEVEAVKEFVGRGGGVLVLGDHDNMFGVRDFQNPVAEQFGISFNEDVVVSRKNSIAGRNTWVKAFSPLFKLKDVGIFCGCSLKLAKGAKPLLLIEDEKISGGRAVLAGYKEEGEGRVVAVGDTEFCWNGDKNLTINYGENRDFSLQTIQWLSGKKIKQPLACDYTLFTGEEREVCTFSTSTLKTEISGGEISLVRREGKKSVWKIGVKRDGWVKFSSEAKEGIVYFLFPPKAEKMKLLIDESNYARRADTSPGGLYELACSLREQGISVFASARPDLVRGCAAVLIASPLASYESIPDFSGFRKIILLAEFRMTLQGEDKICKGFRNNGYKEEIYPLNQIGQGYGIEFTRYVLCKGNKIFFRSPVWAGCIVKAKGKDFKILLKGSKNCRGEDIASGMARPIGKDSADIEDTSIIVCNDRILASGDTDIFTNAHIKSSRKIVKKVVRWLEK